MKQTKRIISLLVCFLVLSAVFPVIICSVSANGASGTPVYNVEDLYNIRNDPEGHYVLMNDIDLTKATADGGEYDGGYGWVPIGEKYDTPFSGVFDGNGHTIKGMRMTGANNNYVGLFGYIVNGTIRNLILSDIDINIPYGAQVSSLGAVCARGEYITLENIGVTGYINAPNVSDVGGLVGDLFYKGTITRCYNKADIYGRMRTAGIAGAVCAEITISETFNTGNITGDSEIGGITGDFQRKYRDKNTVINNSYNTGDIRALRDTGCCGGITGYALVRTEGKDRYFPSVDSCVNTGNVIGAYGGGIMGRYENAEKARDIALSGCYYAAGDASTGKYNTADTPETAVKLTAEKMKLKSSFKMLDFKNVWFIDSSTGYSHPQLTANPEYKSAAGSHHTFDIPHSEPSTILWQDLITTQPDVVSPTAPTEPAAKKKQESDNVPTAAGKEPTTALPPAVPAETTTGGATEPVTASGIIPGDADNDGIVTFADTRLALRRSLGLEAYPHGGRRKLTGEEFLLEQQKHDFRPYLSGEKNDLTLTEYHKDMQSRSAEIAGAVAELQRAIEK